jgi:hypothetical protein
VKNRLRIAYASDKNLLPALLFVPHSHILTYGPRISASAEIRNSSQVFIGVAALGPSPISNSADPGLGGAAGGPSPQLLRGKTMLNLHAMGRLIALLSPSVAWVEQQLVTPSHSSQRPRRLLPVSTHMPRPASSPVRA